MLPDQFAEIAEAILLSDAIEVRLQWLTIQVPRVDAKLERTRNRLICRPKQRSVPRLIAAWSFDAYTLYDAADDSVLYDVIGKVFSFNDAPVGMVLLNSDGTFFETLSVPGAFQKVFSPTGSLHGNILVPIVTPAGFDYSPATGLRIVAESADRLLLLSDRGSYLAVWPLAITPSDVAFTPDGEPHP